MAVREATATVEEFVGALNQAGVKPAQLAGLLQVAGTQAEIEALRVKMAELQQGRDAAIRAAVEPIDAEIQATQAAIDAALAQLESLRKGGK